jgi:hypothetical protein
VSRPRFGAREAAAIALLALAVVIAWPFLDPNGEAGQPRPVELGDTPTPAATAPLPQWRVEILTLAGEPADMVFEGEDLSINWQERPWAVRATTLLALPSPGVWRLVFQHEQPFTVTIDGARYEIGGGAPGQESSVLFQYGGTPVSVEVTSASIEGRLRLRLVAIVQGP